MRCAETSSVQVVKLRLWLTVAAYLVFAAIATQSAYAARATDPCSLLTRDSIVAVLGSELGTGKQSGKADCEWSGSGLRPISVLLEILGPMGSSTPVDRFNTVKTPLPIKGVTKEPIRGIGDDAVYVVTNGFRAALYVKKGDFVFRIQITGLPAEETKAKERMLAQDVLGKV